MIRNYIKCPIYAKILRFKVFYSWMFAKYLANALNYITNNDFVIMFEDHKYALALIEQQTPQTLTILGNQFKAILKSEITIVRFKN